MRFQWSSSGSFLLQTHRESVQLYSVNTSERQPIPQLIYTNDFNSIDREFIKNIINSNFAGFRPDCLLNDDAELNAVSIGMRSKTGEPVIAILRSYTIWIINNSWKRLVELYQIQIINPRISAVNRKFTELINKLIKSSNFLDITTLTTLSQSRHIEKCRLWLSPDCSTISTALYIVTAADLCSVIIFLLDFDKEIATKLNINEFYSTRFNVHWTEDSRILEITHRSGTYFFNCETEQLGVSEGCACEADSRLIGTLCALQWAYRNHINVFCLICNDIAIYDVYIEQTGIKYNCTSRVDLQI